MVIQHNVRAMNANRMLGVTTDVVLDSTEKLSSGYRINRAADDAAGLAISEKMRKQIRGLDRATMNAEDGISCVQTAEGAMNEVQDMLQRMNELCVQAANGTNSETDREYIQDEIDQLVSEVDRVAETTKFNEIYLLKGDEKKGTKKTYITSYVMTYARNRVSNAIKNAVPHRVKYTGNLNLYVVGNEIFTTGTNNSLTVEKVEKGDDVTDYMVSSQSAGNTANVTLNTSSYTAFVNVELNSIVVEGKDGQVNGSLPTTSSNDRVNYDLSTNGYDNVVRANRELYVYDTVTNKIRRVIPGEEMGEYLKDDNAVKDRYRLVDTVENAVGKVLNQAGSAGGGTSSPTPGIVTALTDADYPTGVVQVIDNTNISNYTSYTDSDGKTHYILGNGIYQINGISGVVFDVSGNTAIQNTDLTNVSIECGAGSVLSVKNVKIDNSANVSQTGNGIGSPIKVMGQNVTLNSFGTNEFHGGVDNYIEYNDATKVDGIVKNTYHPACSGINVGNNNGIEFYGTETAKLISYGIKTNTKISYTSRITTMQAAAIGSNFEEMGGLITIYSGHIIAYADMNGNHSSSNGTGAIGGGSWTDIHSYGGTIDAYGGTHFAIGGGDAIEGASQIEINGGTINVYANHAYGGIGIVGYGYIDINGGVINVTGNAPQSVGIGGAYGEQSPVINITGGNITATVNGTSGAAIGTSQYGTGGTVNITGGTIVATSSDTVQAVGNGANSQADVQVYVDGVLTDTTGVDDGNGHHVYTYSNPNNAGGTQGGTGTQATYVDWIDLYLERVMEREYLYDADGQIVSGIALNQYFDESGNYKGGLFSTAQARAVDEVFANDNSVEYQQIKAGGILPALIESYITQSDTDIYQDLELMLHAGADSDRTNKIGVDISSLTPASLGIDKLESTNIGIVDKTGDNATDAIDVIAEAISNVSRQRSALGAVQNRIEHTIRNLDNVIENTQAAESLIRDTDMAEELVSHSNNQILQQAGETMLAQANQSNQGVLNLLT